MCTAATRRDGDHLGLSISRLMHSGVQGACSAANGAATQNGTVPVLEQQCVISAHHSLFKVSGASPGEVPHVWMHNLYVRLHGASASTYEASDDSAAFHLSGCKAWLTSITVVGLKPSSRGLVVQDSHLYAAGTQPWCSTLA